jgi:DNA-binding HxlR family transcriptional regulator
MPKKDLAKAVTNKSLPKKSAVRAINGSRNARPIMVLLDLLGRRMALRILWELFNVEEPLSFRMLQSAAETNPGLLNTRLKELRGAKLIALDEEGYSLTRAGRSLTTIVMPLNEWAKHWISNLRD